MVVNDKPSRRYAFTFEVGLMMSKMDITVNAATLPEAKDKVLEAATVLDIHTYSIPSIPREMREIDDA